MEKGLYISGRFGIEGIKIKVLGEKGKEFESAFLPFSEGPSE